MALPGGRAGMPGGIEVSRAVGVPQRVMAKPVLRRRAGVSRRASGERDVRWGGRRRSWPRKPASIRVNYDLVQS
jgi:hypothetical protein